MTRLRTAPWGSSAFYAAVVAGVIALALPAAAMATPTAIRVGGPSASDESKIAIVGSDKKQKKFSVVDVNGNEVLAGKLTKATGKPAPFKRAYAADLTEITTPGQYTVKVGKLESRPWEVSDSLSGDTIDVILSYFRSNRDGNEASPIHEPSHLNDALIHPDSPVDPGEFIDMTGGWMDAGDMIHFTQTTAFSTALLEASFRLDPGSAIELGAEADVGLRWLAKAHPVGSDVFIAQVGDDRDHEKGFRDPAEDDASSEPGIGTRNAYPEIGGDLGGKAAAALAMGYVRTGDTTYLQQAKEWYSAGKEANRAARRLSKAGYPKYSGNFYNSKNWKDSLASGAAELYRATCLTDCDESYDEDYAEFARSPQSEPYAAMGTVDDFSSFGAAEVCGGFGPTAPFSTESTNIGCDVLARNGKIAVKQARKNAFGMPGYFTWGTTAQNGAAGALAALSTAAPGGPPAGCEVAAGARDYLLGRNPFDSSFVTGYGPNAPRFPHHWAEVFGDSLPLGAVVGGPAPRGQVKGQGFKAKGPFNKGPIVYVDQRKNYVNSEPAIDYSVSSILLVAALRGRC